MKKINLIGILLIAANIASSQKINTGVVYQKCTGFAISKALGDMKVADNNDEQEAEDKSEAKKRRVNPYLNKSQSAGKFVADPGLQKTMGTTTLSAPLVNWQAQSGNYFPPDPSGAAGTAHFYQAVNCKHAIYNKLGTMIAGPFNLSTLWAGSTNDGDPIVMYDKYADRWFMSQFNGSDQILVAVSTSSNPAGTYYTYTFTPAPGTFPDYPKYSVWADGYYCTSNLGSPENMVVFERSQMLIGSPSASMISLLLPPTANNGFFCPLAGDADGTLPPYGTPCPMFTYEDDTWPSSGADQLHVFKFSTDWITPANSTLVLDTLLPTNPINTNFTSSWDDVPQPGTSQKLDAISGVLMYRAQYRRWPGYNTVVLNHSVIVDTITLQVGIRWYELRQNSSTNKWSINQQGTYAPDQHSRWMGSIAMDDNGSISMAYAVSSPTVSPSLRYTGRLSTDPPGMFTFSEITAIAGTGAQTGFNRYGDYSQTTMDPDGITFWHTGEYLSSGQARTRIFSWQIPLLTTGINNNSPSNSNIIISQDGNILKIRGNNIQGSEKTQVDLFDVLGKQLNGKMVSAANGSFETTMDISGLAKATYLVRVGNEKFQKVEKVVVN